MIYNKLILSGGGIKGLITLGSLQYFYDKKLLNNVNEFIGTSVGSIICFLLSIGYTPIELIVSICTTRIFEKVNTIDIISLSNNEGGIDWNIINEYLETLTINKIGKLITLKELYDEFGKNFTAVTFNYTDKKVEYISKETHPNMNCLLAIKMSSNIPLIFKPFKYEHKYYVDGAIGNNFPINCVKETDEKILAINLTKKHVRDVEKLGFLSYIWSLLLIHIDKNVTENLDKYKDIKNIEIISLNECKNTEWNINLDNIDMLNMFSSGYSFTKNHFK
tara:strand:+ start:22 stop:852 length:831 start_codon:yes stop_codon:yes gene_type:complete